MSGTATELERALADLGAHLEHPSTPPLAEAVLARISEPAPRAAPSRRPLGWPAWTGWAGRPGWRRIAAVTLALVVLAAGIVVATPSAREAVARRLGLPGVAIHLGGQVPPVTSLPPGVGANLDLGRRVTLEQAGATASFGVLVPTAAGFDRPDAVYLSDDLPGGRVDFVYRPRPGLPTSPGTGVGLLITQFSADLMVEKIAKGTNEVRMVNVGGETGYWFGPGEHFFTYLDRGGGVRNDTSRLAGPTLLWSRGPVTLRLEGQLNLSRAVEIASSMR
jgi:hypothetical protein